MPLNRDEGGIPMRALMLCLVFGTASPALAMPNVGDQSTYDYNMVGFEAGTKELLVLAQTHSSPDAFLVRVTTKPLFKEPQVKEETWYVDGLDLLNDQQIDDILRDCVASGYQLQRVRIPAGTFDTCQVKGGAWGVDSVRNIGKVPFGMVKDTSNAGPFFMFTRLRSFEYGRVPLSAAP